MYTTHLFIQKDICIIALQINTMCQRYYLYYFLSKEYFDTRVFSFNTTLSSRV